MPRWWVRMSPCRMRASPATPPDTGPTSGAVASVGRVLPGLAFPCASAIRHRDRAPPAFPRERDRPAAPARTPRPPDVPAGTRSPRGTAPGATPPDVPAGTRSLPPRGTGPGATPPDVPAGTRPPSAPGADPDAAPPDVPAGTRRSRGNATTVCPRRRPGRRALRGNAITVCPRRRPGRRAPGRSRGNVPPFPQRLRVYVQHHLIPVTGRPPVEAARQCRLGQRPDGVRLPLRERRLFHVGRSAGRRGGRFVFRARRRVGGVLLRAAVRRRRAPSLVASRLQRAPQHRPDLRRQPPADNHHPVLVHPRPQPAARVPPPLLRLLHVPVDAPPRAGDPLHVRRRARQRHVEQGLLVLRGGDPGDRAHLRVGDPAAAHGVAQLRQLSEGARHADVLAGGPRREPGPPAQPVRARQATVPALLLVELADEDEQLVGGGLDAGGQLGDAVAEPGELRSAVAGRSRPPAGGGSSAGPA